MALDESGRDAIVDIVIAHYPATQGIYLYGSFAIGEPWPGSDVDLAVLLPHGQAKRVGSLAADACRAELETAIRRPVDLVNARQVSTVLQKEVITGVRLYCADARGMDEFEMLTLSMYQKLNEERAEILAAFEQTGRAYPV